ncbi:17167_t:CDS:1 [Funneliformis geosporum]|uniref:17167_t:CDS:1 n=1 Tax=Funneliformis geosporum TaxID=1117311 RepID=A0A9W4SR22_9GLOM|nr:17167_t:CDS:1 [Funneliformis geosporum]
MIHISESFFLPPASKLPRPTSSSKDQTSSEVLRSGESSKTSRSETALRTGTAPRATNSTSKSTTPVLRPTTPFVVSRPTTLIFNQNTKTIIIFINHVGADNEE